MGERFQLALLGDDLEFAHCGLFARAPIPDVPGDPRLPIDLDAVGGQTRQPRGGRGRSTLAAPLRPCAWLSAHGSNLDWVREHGVFHLASRRIF
ncbi:MAG: hypothetical protein CBC48_12205 [bacterium TMED88]|nr:MAG: hypothetical protein CBC48_12205 [bacterium TMED88]